MPKDMPPPNGPSGVSFYPDPYAGQQRAASGSPQAAPSCPSNGVGSPSVIGALQQVVHSSHQLLIDRLDLFRLDVQEGIRTTVQKAVLRVASGFFALHAFYILTVAACLYLATMLPAHQAVCIVGFAYLALAALLWFAPRAGRVTEEAKEAVQHAQVKTGPEDIS